MTDTPQVVMVIDDDASMRQYLANFLAARGYAVEALATADEAVPRFEQARPVAVILDVVMPGGMDGLEALAAFKKIDRGVPVIVVSGQGRTATVVQAMKLGASDFVSKPFTDADLEAPLASALKQQQLTREMASLREELQAHDQPLLVGRCPCMDDVRAQIQRVADSGVSVLIRGESGTGKELVARAIHAASGRRDKPFVKVNCAALPPELLEAELFGYERGAFTGAHQHKPGKFEFASHGTMFLDEIGEMSLPLQGKVLQLLADGGFSRLGGRQDVRVDVRLLAATNHDLEAAVAGGRFNEDLACRLSVVSIAMPPLRERRDDLPLLTAYFLKKYSVQYNKPYAELPSETMRLFMEHEWPGNVRELEQLIKRVVILGAEDAIIREVCFAIASAARQSQFVASPIHTHAAIPNPPSKTASPAAMAAAAADAGNYSLKAISRTAAREAERELITRMLQHTRWNRKETAQMLGISYKALLYKIKENGLDKAS